MKKTIKTLSLISFCIAILACVLVIVALTMLWEPFCFVFSNSMEMVEMRPIIPIGSMVYLFGCLLAPIILIASNKLRKPIILDVILIIFLIIVIPVVSWLLSVAQSISIASVNAMKSAALTVTGYIVDYLLSLIDISKCLCCVICGMRIATVAICKNIDPNLEYNNK